MSGLVIRFPVRAMQAPVVGAGVPPPASPALIPFTPGEPVRVRAQPKGPVMLVVDSDGHETHVVTVRDYGGPGQVVIVNVPTAALMRVRLGEDP